MASLDLDPQTTPIIINAYQPGKIEISGKIYTQSLIALPHKLITDWAIYSADALTPEIFQSFLPYTPSIIILGTGPTLKWQSVKLYGELFNHGIGVEVMDTSAACRTFNALCAENRNVLAALIL